MSPSPQTTNLSPQEIGYCSGGLYWVLPECWGLAHSAWQAAAALPAIPASVVQAPGAPSDLYTLPDTTGQTAQALSDAAIAGTQSNVSDYVSTLADNPLGTQPCEWMGISCTTLVWIAVAVAAVAWIGSGGR